MKYIVIAIPGAADQPAEELGGKTPFEVAKIPNINHFTKLGRAGVVKLMPQKGEPSADASFLSLLGYDPNRIYPGRGPLEAANLDLELEDNEIPFRMNFITESGGSLADPTAGGLTTKEAQTLVDYLNQKISSGFVRFFAGDSYRHIAVFKDAQGFRALSAKTEDPETFIGEKLSEHLPKGPGEELLKKMMYDARLLLQDHEINQVRVDLMENPANMIWLWGQGQKPKLEKFSSLYGVRGAVAARMEYARGAGRLAGMEVIRVPEKTGDPETDLARKAKAALEALKSFDYVCCHLSGCDEASRMGNCKAKISALEAADFFFLSWVREYFEKNKQTRILITPLHVSPWKTRRHTRDAVPFAAAGPGIMPDEVEKFSELAAKSTELAVQDGRALMMTLLKRE